MAKYRLTQRAIIDDRQREIGEEIEYDGIPGPHMEPLDAAAKKAVADLIKAGTPGINPDFQAHPAETAQPGVAAAPAAAEAAAEEEKEDKKDEKEERHGRRN